MDRSFRAQWDLPSRNSVGSGTFVPEILGLEIFGPLPCRSKSGLLVESRLTGYDVGIDSQDNGRFFKGVTNGGAR
jgi:hypothetical protein